MEQNYEQLVQYLSEEKKLYDELLKISIEKKKAIIENEVSILDFIVESETDFVNQIFKIEKSRVLCVKNIGKNLNIENPTLQQIIEASDQDTKDLEKIMQDLKKVVSKLKSYNDGNNSLVKMQLDYIDSLKSAMFDIQTNYGMDGKDVIDKRQSINLLDRMV